MSVTAKELASILGLSQTAVSMALNNKPGVSTETRYKVIKAAEQYGYDFSRLKPSQDEHKGFVYVIFYKTNDAILSYMPIFNEIWEGARSALQKENTPARMLQVYEKSDDMERVFQDIRVSGCCGIILLGTEMRLDVCRQFLSLDIPMVLLDTYYDALDCTSILSNNRQGAYIATDYLISRCHTQPGYLESSYKIPNFSERRQGFDSAVRENGMSSSRCIRHTLSTTIEGAMADMLEILDNKDPVARCYFADNDIIAIGAMKAFQSKGYRIPEDVAFAGFDNISEGRVVDPALTTMDVPRYYMGQTAARLLMEQVHTQVFYTQKVEITTRLIKRFSV